jgi:hypothetical protein
MGLRRRHYLGFLSLMLLCLIAYTPLQGSAGLVWSETFDELNPEVWTTLLSCKVEDGALRGIQSEAPHHISAVRASRVSNTSVGTWKFELTDMRTWDEELDVCKVFFMSPGDPTYDDYYALSINHAGGQEGERYVYTIEKYLVGSPFVILASHVGETRTSTVGLLHRFAITRTANGRMSVYLNSSLILSVVDTDITETTIFGYYTWDDWAFDNVYVYDSIELGGQLTVLFIGMVVLGIVAIIAVVIVRRRQ